ncbi:hypothetical protein SV7mr_51030 [Stieleria bergensis]|uniref:Uncharacterized protein n=1 Tax=Stieleria bergensis TaxID=2528025 RepID=A0A517T2E1_9BACT|nr:hypothetical protein SV7mr_51030 [Planctomycetes bacterium SV_7m_r]
MIPSFVLFASFVVYSRFCDDCQPVPRVRCATLGYGVEHLRRSGIQDGGQPRRMIVIPSFVLFASFVVYSRFCDDCQPVPRVRCATLGYGIEHLRRSGIQDWGQSPEDDCDSLLRALRVLRGLFPVLRRLPVCPQGALRTLGYGIEHLRRSEMMRDDKPLDGISLATVVYFPDSVGRRKLSLEARTP